jgi:hypothetical protein
MKTAGVVGISLAGISAVIAVVANAQMSGGLSRNVQKTDQVADAVGNLHVPDSYRSTYEFLGSWAVVADQGQGAKELHIVYASPGTAACRAFEENFLSKIKAKRTFAWDGYVISGNKAYIVYRIDLDHADLGRLNVNEVAIQEWANGKVEHEKFVY